MDVLKRFGVIRRGKNRGFINLSTPFHKNVLSLYIQVDKRHLKIFLSHVTFLGTTHTGGEFTILSFRDM